MSLILVEIVATRDDTSVITTVDYNQREFKKDCLVLGTDPDNIILEMADLYALYLQNDKK